MPAANPAIELLKQLIRENPGEALTCLKNTPNLKKRELSALLTEAITRDPLHTNLIEYLMERNNTTPQELFIWLISNNHLAAFKRYQELGYQVNPAFREKRYGYTPQEMALAAGHYRMLSLITGDSLLVSFLKTKFTSLELNTQLWLIRRMQSLGLPVRSEGICHAVAIFGGQALLADGASQFMRRTKLVKSTTYIDLPGIIQQAEIHRANKDNLSQSQQDYLDFTTFSEGVELTQSCDYSEWDKALGQATPSTLRLLKALESVELEQEGGLALIDSQALVDIDLNNAQKFKDFLVALAHNLDSCLNPHKPKQAVFIYCSNFRHAISLGYDIKKKHWYFVDANHKKLMVQAKNIEHLAALFKQAFVNLGGPKQSFKLSLFTTASNRLAVETAITPGWQTQCHPFFTPSREWPIGYYTVSLGVPVLACIAVSLLLKASPAFALACSALMHPILAVMLTMMITLIITSLVAYLVYRLVHKTTGETANPDQSGLNAQDDFDPEEQPSMLPLPDSSPEKKPVTALNKSSILFFKPHTEDPACSLDSHSALFQPVVDAQPR
ncbi:hypothetical protein [Legionella erythra]|uniref:Uncharacterized protein n=1 Tax=Legionella erythra TaxID=448 RepID=A0A0W0TRR9_LEGER|nr:hypothetical protein [Legionella erythra]KTC98246.1 hypothetical protein Lery_1300 [Legionella erythra]